MDRLYTRCYLSHYNAPMPIIRYRSALAVLACAILAAPLKADESNPVAIPFSQINRTMAEPVDIDEPVYPRPALHENREGWVLVNFDIDTNGRVINATPADSVGGSIFEKAALRSVERRRYRPAQQDGQAVFQGRNSEFVVFSISKNARGSSQRFADRYNDILDLMDKDKLDRAEVLAQSVFDQWPLNLYELTKIWSLRAELALIQNDLLAADDALRKATANSGHWLDDTAYQSLLLAMVHVDLEIGQYKSAMDTFRQLAEMNPGDSDALEQTRNMISSVRDAINSKQILATDGIILRSESCDSCQAKWSFSPVRNAFNIFDIDGRVTAIDIVCDATRMPRTHFSEGIWRLPQDAGTCRVDVTGDVDTTFKIHQLADGT